MKHVSSKQRFHRHRDVLVPHSQMSGILLTINPLQADRALREAQNYFNTLTEDLQRTQECPNKTTSVEDFLTVSSTSALLAKELESAIEEHKSRKRCREVEQASASWFSLIDTCCKGYLLLRVPMVAYSEVIEEGIERPVEESSGHAISINPLVSNIVERVFSDLKSNPRPVFRHCFRLMPVELTCCPTTSEMIKALTTLLSKHFPSDPNEAPFQGNLSKPFGFANSFTHRRSLVTVLFKFSVKNNTKVEGNQRAVQQALVQLFPLNKFTVVQRDNRAVEAAVQILVAQSTCLMGVQRCFSERQAYNVGQIGRSAFEVTAMLKND